ncbi:MAG: beta-ketoacyl-ACP synthase II [Planctomycetes bacterium]|nr:beta-ketoacyl-ACP synthase II [Planctomycetota bacterium]
MGPPHHPERRRVVITGVAGLTPIGRGTDDYWRGIAGALSGAGPITRFDTEGWDVRIAAELKGFDPGEFLDRKEVRRLDPFVHYAMAAAIMAVADAGLDLSRGDAARHGAILGTGIGGLTELEEQVGVLVHRGQSRVSPFLIPKLMSNASSGNIAIRFGLKGPNYVTASACASANHAMGDAFQTIREGRADVLLTGGSEATITQIGVAGFQNMKALSTRNDDPQRASRPFDRERDGFVMGEGAGVLVFEELAHARRRDAQVYAEVLGFGATDDSHHITAPEETGEGAARAMNLALEDGGVSPDEVDYINAHGTSTPYNDKTETRAIKQVFGGHARRLAVSSTKSQIGHLLGASGGAELVAVCLAMRHGLIPPTINYANPDPECDLDYVPNEARPGSIRRALSNSFGFGGHNATILVGAPD